MIRAAMDTIKPLGRFSLRAAAAFGFGPTEGRPPSFDGAMRLAFCVDGGQGYAGAVLRQREDDGPVGVELTLRDGAAPEAALAQAARTVSLDHDGMAFAQVGDRDPVIGALQRAQNDSAAGSSCRDARCPPSRSHLRWRRSPTPFPASTTSRSNDCARWRLPGSQATWMSPGSRNSGPRRRVSDCSGCRGSARSTHR
jgi:hypothetical protein